jgi:hypothetical protein
MPFSGLRPCLSFGRASQQGACDAKEAGRTTGEPFPRNSLVAQRPTSGVRSSTKATRPLRCCREDIAAAPDCGEKERRMGVSTLVFLYIGVALAVIFLPNPLLLVRSSLSVQSADDCDAKPHRLRVGESGRRRDRGCGHSRTPRLALSTLNRRCEPAVGDDGCRTHRSYQGRYTAVDNLMPAHRWAPEIALALSY